MRGLGPGARRLAISLLSLALGALGCGDDGGEETRPVVEADRPTSPEEWKARREQLDASVWASETLAHEYERTLVSLWDALLDADRRRDPAGTLDALTSVGFDELEVGRPTRVERLEHGIGLFEFSEPHRTLSQRGWRELLEEFAASGYKLVQTEWHHARFEPGADGAPPRSRVAVLLHLLDTAGDRRIALDGELAVEWSERRDARGHHLPARVDATGLRMLTRAGAAPFEKVRTFSRPSPGSQRRLVGIHPVLLYDLDEDGLSEIVMVRANRVLWNLGNFEFRAEELSAHARALTETGVVADLTGEGHPDLMSTTARGGLVVFPGDEKGRFRDPPLEGPRLEGPLQAPSVLSVGDVDADGDLDVWVAQYKPAYRGGQMPSPFYDANDGFPSYLLANDGSGRFSPVTEAAGLAEKRFRRTYASSFVDLDDDRDLDLLVVSDYSGIDLYHNDGSGRFTDANHTLLADRHLFGMSASFADYDLDGRLDFFVAGMASTTARRLEALGLGREDRPEVQAMRMRMAFGNRMYLASDSGWREPDFAAQVARTGWTWGTTAFDFDNDGDPDLFAANGHESGESTDDYCANFWTHDIYDGRSEPDPALAALFEEETRGLVTGKKSWDGHQKNHLLMNREGRGFLNVAFLMGVADQFDSRSAVSDDLDRDGRVDLVVVEDLGAEGEKLHVYRNGLETDHAWIGVQLEEQGAGVSPVGAEVRVRTPGRVQVRRVVTGETLMGQHSTALHFGLGDATRVDAIEVRWLDGRTRVLRDPEPGRYHRVLAPGDSAASGAPTSAD